MKRLLTLLVILLLAPAAHAQDLTASTYFNGLKAAKPGAVIRLVGDYPKPINVPGLKNITIDASAATIATIKLDRAENVKLIGGLYRANAAVPAGQASIHVINSTGVDVSGVELDGGKVMFRDSRAVSLTDATIMNTAVGVTVLNVDGLAITNLSLWRMAGDGVNLWSVRNGKVAYVTCAGFKLKDPKHHPDCVQLANYAGAPPTVNVSIRFVMVSGETQGVAAFTTGGRYTDVAFDHVWVMGRNYPQGVALYDADGASVTNSTLIRVPGTKHGPWMNVLDVTGVTKCGNRAIAADGQFLAIDKPC